MGAANLLASSGQDVDFFIHGVFSYELFGQTFWITTTHVAIAIVMLLVVIFAIAARITISHAKKYPTGFQNIVEMIVEMLDKMVESSMGPYAKSSGITSEAFSSLFFSVIYQDFSDFGRLQQITV